MSFNLEARNKQLFDRSQMVINGRPTNKLDFLGTISIYNCEYFNVYRRYNNVHEIVVEDYNYDLHFVKNETLRETLEGILCLSREQTKNLYIHSAFSFKHQSDIEIANDIVNMTWSDIQHMWGGLVLNLGGILEEFHRAAMKTNESPAPSISSSVPNAPTKCRQISYQFNGAKRQRLSDLFTEMEEAHMKQEQENTIVDEEEEDDEGDYMQLRSGMTYYKK